MEFKDDLKNALTELRKEEPRKFDQTVDLLINLQKFDPKKNQVNIFVTVPFRVKDKRICAFLESRSPVVDTITGEEFKKYTDKKMLKKLVKNYDFFISQASLMPKVATTFGRVLGPSGKMPSPQLGIVSTVNEKELNEVKKRVDNSIKIKTTQPSIKIAVGKQSMKDEEIINNVIAIYDAVVKALPRNKENIKNVDLKFTMSKKQRILIK